MNETPQKNYNMQTLKLRPVFNLIATNHTNVRTIGLSTEAHAEQNLKSWKKIPGPSSLPIIGQLLHFLPGGSLHGAMGLDFQNHLYENYGPIVRIDGMLGTPPMVFVFDANAAEQVLRGEDAMPIRPGLNSYTYYKKVYSRNKNDPINRPTGLVTENGQPWKDFRSLVNPILLKPKSIKMYTDILDQVALDMVARLKSVRDENNMIQKNFDQEMNLWALESISVVALGDRINCLDFNLPQESPANRLIKVSHDIMKVFHELDLKPSMWKYISTPTFRYAMKVYEEQKLISQSYIRRAMKQMQDKDHNSEDEKSILEKLLDIDEDTAVTMATDMLLGGVDTITSTIISVLYFLASNPEKQDKLRQEVTSNKERRPYLKACIKETIRLKPTATMSMRQLSKDYSIMGHKIPKHVFVMMGHNVLCLMEEHYPRPQEYIPERWTAERDDPLYRGNAHPFAYNPFGFGTRSCIGRRIAELEIETFLARMIENFQLEWVGPPLKTYTTLINNALPPFNFIFNDIK